MDVVGSNHVIQDRQTISFSCLIEQMEPSVPVFREFKQEFPLVTPVGNVPDVSGEIMSLGSSHEYSLYRRFHTSKGQYSPKKPSFQEENLFISNH